jgi:hypothetical protein
MHIVSAIRFESPYYTSLWNFFSGLLNYSTGHEYQDKWSLFDIYLTNIELIHIIQKAYRYLHNCQKIN